MKGFKLKLRLSSEFTLRSVPQAALGGAACGVISLRRAGEETAMKGQRQYSGILLDLELGSASPVLPKNKISVRHPDYRSDMIHPCEP